MNFLLSLLNRRNLIIFILVLFALITLQAFYQVSDTDITSESTVKEWIDSGALIVDVRTPEEYAAGHYTGSMNIPLADIDNRLLKFGKKEGKIVVYCRSGNRSGKAKNILESHGFKNVINGGGLKEMP